MAGGPADPPSHLFSKKFHHQLSTSSEANHFPVNLICHTGIQFRLNVNGKETNLQPCTFSHFIGFKRPNFGRFMVSYWHSSRLFVSYWHCSRWFSTYFYIHIYMCETCHSCEGFIGSRLGPHQVHIKGSEFRISSHFPHHLPGCHVFVEDWPLEPDLTPSPSRHTVLRRRVTREPDGVIPHSFISLCFGPAVASYTLGSSFIIVWYRRVRIFGIVDLGN